MITPRLRPRLELESTLPPAELAEHVQRRLREPGCPCLGLATSEQVDLRIRDEDRRFWSPQVTVHVEPAGGGSVLTGHFGPDAHVWTLFLAMYAFVVLSAVFGSFYGFSQMIIGETPWILVSVPIALVLVVLIYVAAGIGQRLGHDQTDVLHEFLESAVAADDDPNDAPRSPRDGE